MYQNSLRSYLLAIIVSSLFFANTSIAEKASPPPSPIAGMVWQEPVTGMEFVWVPEGCYEMGVEEDKFNFGNRVIPRYDVENKRRYYYELPPKDYDSPVHKVCVDGFWMGKYEVTVAQYKQLNPDYTVPEKYVFKLDNPSQPVGGVNWIKAQQYARQLSTSTTGAFVLPTETEWEYAAKAGTDKRYFAQDAEDHDLICENGNFAYYCGKPRKIVAVPVGSYEPNQFGLYDMLGNVSEWCEDMYSDKGYSVHSEKNPITTPLLNPDGTGETLASSPAKQYEDDETMIYRVVRGGSSWAISGTVDRHKRAEFTSSMDQGFRLVYIPKSKDDKRLENRIKHAPFGRMSVMSAPVKSTVNIIKNPAKHGVMDGVFLPPGTYSIAVSRYGFITQTQDVTVTENKDINISVRLEMDPNFSQLKIVTAPTGAQIDFSGVAPQLVQKYDTVMSWGAIQDRRVAEIRNDDPEIWLKDGDYQLEISSPGFETVKQIVTVPPPNGEPVLITLPVAVTSEERGQAYSIGDKTIDPVTGMEFVWVPGGCYVKKGNGPDMPPQDVCVNGFWMGKYEVTNRQYKANSKYGVSNSYDLLASGRFWQAINPVNVKWREANIFASWLSERSNSIFRLPTEAEWEYAARAGLTTDTYWADDQKSMCNYIQKDTCQQSQGYNMVGSHLPNDFGLYDMLGNQDEWVLDAFVNENESKIPASSRGALYNPIVYGNIDNELKHESERVKRGGKYDDTPHYFSFSNRGYAGVSEGGFRLVRVESSEKIEEANNSSKLTINTKPSSAKIKFLYNESSYSHGMELEQGPYHVEVSAAGYDSRTQIINLAGKKELSIDIDLHQSDPKSIASGSSFTDHITGMEFVRVKGGCYNMGDTFGDGSPDEKPVHEVCVDDFYIGKYEVTQAEYVKITGNNPSVFKLGENYPVEKISWDDIQSSINELNRKSGKNYRLPTEAEWEYAARSGGGNEKYAGGHSVDAVAWYRDNSEDKTHAVGTKEPNGLGIFDMNGNVWEWCSDYEDHDYYTSSPKHNPKGPISGNERVYRGGSWYNPQSYVRSTLREGISSDISSYNIGFRLVLKAQ